MVALMMPSPSHDDDTIASGVTWPKSHVAPHLNCQPKECSGAIDNAVGITWHQCLCHWHHKTKEVMFHLILIVLTSEVNSAIGSAIWHQVILVPMTLYDSKSHIAPHFICHALGNSMVPFMVPSVSCDADTGTNGITWQRKSCCTTIQLSWPKKCSSVIDDAVGIIWCRSQKGVIWPKETCCKSFHLSLCKENSNTIYDAVDIIWHQHHWQLCHITKKAMLHQILILLT